MPNHLHLLITTWEETTLERAVQLIKGGFSFRVKKELGITSEIWQRGYVDHRVRDRSDYEQHRKYIHANPVRAGIASDPKQYSYSSASGLHVLDSPPQGLKPNLIKWEAVTIQREQLEADVLIVGAGPAGLACALHLANLIKAHNAGGAKPELSAENIYVLEKGRELGAHQLSGAIMNPKALAELVPDFEKSAPLDTPVTDSAALLFTEKSSFRFPITPPPFQNKGNYVVSLSKLVKWLGEKVEAAGVNVFKEFGGAQLIYEREGIGGVVTEDKGIDKNGKPKDNFQPGYELKAKVTVLAEGTRGSLTKELVAKKKLDNINPQSYGIGVKELWDVQPGKIQSGYVAHTLGYPVPSSMYGGGWIYGLSNRRVSIGLVVALEYADPRFDPHATFQKWKTNPFVAKLLEGGKLVRYGAKSLPYGGWYAMPRNYFDGGLIVGDAGSFLDSQKLKGIHLAIKSGMLAAEAAFEALKTGDTSAKTLSAYQTKIEQSYIKKELWKVRNFHQGFAHGQFRGFINTAFQQITSGRGLVDPMRAHAGHEAYKKISQAISTSLI